jgi:hypothetical protein
MGTRERADLPFLTPYRHFLNRKRRLRSSLSSARPMIRTHSTPASKWSYQTADQFDHELPGSLPNVPNSKDDGSPVERGCGQPGKALNAGPPPIGRSHQTREMPSLGVSRDTRMACG